MTNFQGRLIEIHKKGIKQVMRRSRESHQKDTRKTLQSQEKGMTKS